MHIALIYLVVGSLYILFSDNLVATAVSDPQVMAAIQSVKGLGFILVTTVMLYVLVRRERAKLIAKEAEKRRFLHATIGAMNHILRNFLTSMTLFREHAAEAKDFDPAMLQLFDTVAREATASVEQLSDLTAHTERAVTTTVHGPAAGDGPGAR